MAKLVRKKTVEGQVQELDNIKYKVGCARDTLDGIVRDLDRLEKRIIFNRRW